MTTERDMVEAARLKGRPWRVVADIVGRNEIDLRRAYDTSWKPDAPSPPRPFPKPDKAATEPPKPKVWRIPSQGRKADILACIKRGANTAAKIAERLGLERSTVSVHLVDIKRAGKATFERDSSGNCLWRLT